MTPRPLVGVHLGAILPTIALAVALNVVAWVSVTLAQRGGRRRTPGRAPSPHGGRTVGGPPEGIIDLAQERRRRRRSG